MRSKQRKATVIFWGIPIIYVLLFGLLYMGNAVKYIPTVIYDQDQTQLSRKLVQAFTDSERFEITAYVATQEEFEEYMREKKVQVGIAIPPDFTRDVKKGVVSQVLVEVNGSNLVFANSAIGPAQEIISTFAAVAGQSLLEASNQLPAESIKRVAPLRFGLRVINNPTYAYTNFIIAGLAANGLQIAIFLVLGSLIHKEYHWLGKRKNVRTRDIVLGKLLPYWLSGFVIYVLSLVAICQLFNVPLKGSLGEFALIGSAFVFATAAISLFIGAFAPDEIQATSLPLLYVMPSLLFSGYIWPQMSMNMFSKAFAKIVPIAYMADDVRDLMLNGYAPRIFHDALILYLGGALFLMMACYMFQSRRSKFSQHGVIQ